jgi:hypothetical protein
MHAHCRITGHSEVETIYCQLPHSRQISRNDPTEGIQQAHIYGFPVIGLVIGTKDTVTKDRSSCESELALKLSQGGADAE